MNHNIRYPIIPLPQQLIETNDTFSAKQLQYSLKDIEMEEIHTIFDFLHRKLEKISISNDKNDNISTSNLVLIKSIPSLADLGLPDYIRNASMLKQAYKLEIDSKSIIITANSRSGFFYGMQTLIQLVNNSMLQKGYIELPGCKILDWPAFPMRGLMHDVGRNFQSIDFLKHQLEHFARYKINVFHWHLTDHPAWRIECKCFPNLNNPKYCRPTRDPGKFYTYDQIRDLIQFCADREILVIPEIDMPGHSTVFRDALKTRMWTLRGMRQLKKILEEFFTEIPKQLCPIIHIGSDEVALPWPKKFMKTILKILNKYDREPAIWNPGLPTGQPVIFQNWTDKARKIQGYKYLDSKGLYINNCIPISFVQQIFFSQPCDVIPGTDTDAYGGILCHWPDVNVNEEQNILNHSPVYSSVLAFAERFWLGAEKKFPEFQGNIPLPPSQEYEKYLNFESRLLYHRDNYFSKDSFVYSKQCGMEWNIIGPIDNSGKPSSSFPIEDSIEESYVIANREYKWEKMIGTSLFFRNKWKNAGRFPKAKNGTIYAHTWIELPKSMEIPFLIGFELPFRSNRQYRGIPLQGEWDTNGGKIWINQKPLPPPHWKEPGKYKLENHASWRREIHEVPFRDEEFYWTRDPITIKLEKGLNEILIKIPHAYKFQNWTVAFIPIESPSKNPKAHLKEADNIKFAMSPN
jgi:glycosyl hydrolase family 20